MTEKRQAYLTKNAKKVAERSNYRNYYVKVFNQSTKSKKYGYSKLVSRDKAMDYTHGKFDPSMGIRKLHMKDQYIMKEIV